MTPRRTLATASLGTVAVLVAFTAPLANFNQTVAGLGAGHRGGTWVLSSMSIGLGALLLTAGRLADDYGRRRWFVIGSTVLGIASLLGAFSGDVSTFVLSRVAAGAGGAAVVAAGLGMIAAAHPDPVDRGRATGLWGASIGAGIALGPLLGNYLSLLHSWRDVYVVIGVAGLVLAVAGRACPESRSAARARLDVPGVLLMALGTAALLAGLTEGRAGWDRPDTLGLLGLGVALLVAFVVVECRSTHPMLDLGLLRRPAFRAVNIAGLATGAGIIALMSYVSGFVGAALAISATTAAWLMLAWSLPSVVTAVLARRLPVGWSGRTQMSVALAVIAAGQLSVLGISEVSGPSRFVPGLLLAGVATGILNAAMGRESVASVPAGQAGLGSGANNTARYLGSALGVTVVSVVAAPTGVATAQGLVDGWHRAVIVTAVVSLAGAIGVALLGERVPAPEPSRSPTQV
ncbi:MFS transporter [Nocardioides KLBMP 9356]|uniref:MFS transporter n=1 Tax=Nocardioides potassii TaxID=2911371 RepID=A0ABS9HH79_9ACTN|nr:MFS transporter [Nocardioides potassii]MCF6379473.1 MFS transporter [Nocardioides potassii]